ncbi:glycoside hydrolase family 2 TIM barrel-domain containing protein [Niabella hirudinis]|uniref:glycoside hydrolase family 2 TIM barrel-domain containing protein n=1 Tax=Niabella hirudinis TaxID=1285929 RepID=UPI003EB79094
MKYLLQLSIYLLLTAAVAAQEGPRRVIDFNKGWRFRLGDAASWKDKTFDDKAWRLPAFNDATWRLLDLPHDWSIEGRFDPAHPAGNAGGALPGGTGWYRKTFTLENITAENRVRIEFDGIYRNAEVWINGHYLGKWPYGYTSFAYELTPYLKAAKQKNVIAVKVDNSRQPNSRWYTGSGIYRNTRLVITQEIAFENWGNFVYTTRDNNGQTWFHATSNVLNTTAARFGLSVSCTLFDPAGTPVAEVSGKPEATAGAFRFKAVLKNPALWSVTTPQLYRAVFKIFDGARQTDQWATSFGVRYFSFDAEKGFSLNGFPLKIKGVCMHHDLGALGAAFNRSAAKRQLRIMQEMGVNAIRTAHNPPDPQLLDLCDEMGFLVMDESFDMWAKKKNKYDYYSDFPEWHRRDLESMVKRDRNHPSVFMWSIGNEIREQFDSTGITLAKELVDIVKALDTTRPVTCALSENRPDKNFIYQSKALDVVGLNYHIEAYEDFPKNYPGEKFIATENVSGLATRGHYDGPADSLRLWPSGSKFKFVENGNPDYTVSAYDNVAAYWGSTHEQTWRIIKKHDYLSGLFVWSGFDFLGEPVPYPYPARSSYYGIVDLAGFPKDVYYMYQSEWTSKPVLHIAPHWNWKRGQQVDVKVYYSQADEVELFLNGRSLGRRQKKDTAFHVLWRVSFEPGTLKAVSRKDGKTVLERTVRTAGAPAQIALTIENPVLRQDKDDRAFVTIRILDREGNLVPDARHRVRVTSSPAALVVAMDNGYQADLEPFQTSRRSVYNGMGLAIIKGVKKGGAIVTVTSPGLKPASVSILVK